MEAAALTKGSQRVMNNKDLVAGIADAMRDDARAHPQNFPAGSGRSFQKAPDEELAQWFLENLDKIEKAGYEGTIYSRDGVNSDWIARRYIAGSHNWEDIIGVLNMNLRDWYLLRNRDMLDPAHKDLPKFNSIRDVGKYLSTHYHSKLAQIRDAAKDVALRKMAKKATLVDNEDYTIYTVFNWAAARSIGLGTQWCTANSNNDHNYNYYASNGMLFQLFPKEPEQIEKGHIRGTEKYQFDAGSGSFMDISDTVAPSALIKQKFPYLYTDLVGSLKANKEKLESAMAEMADDVALSSSSATKTRTYKIDDEIKKLKDKLGKFFTDKVRPAAEPEQEQLPPPDQPVQEDDAPGVGDDMATGGGIGAMGGDTPPAAAGTYPPGTAPTMPESFKTKGNIMENVDKDVAAMLNSLKRYDMLARALVPMNYIQEKKNIDKPTQTPPTDVKPTGVKPTAPGVKPAAVAPTVVKPAAPVAPAATATAPAAPAAVPAAPAAAPSGGTGDTRGASTSTSTGGATAHRNTGAATGGAVTITISGSSRTDTSTTTETSTETSTATDSKSAGKGPVGEGKSSKGASRAADVSATGRTGEDRPNVFNITVNSTGQSGNAIDGEGGGEPEEEQQNHEEEQQNKIDDRNDKAELRAGTTTPPQFLPKGHGGANANKPSQQPQNRSTDMNQQVKQGRPQMENVDKDVAAMLANLKKYDTLRESVAPVLGMVTLGEKKKEEKGGKPEWLEKAEKKAEGKKDGFKSKKDDEKIEEKKENKTSGKNSPLTYGDENVKEEKKNNKTSGKNSPLTYGDENVKEDNKEKVEEGVDADILNWMKRFAKLGNMKGYGR